MKTYVIEREIPGAGNLTAGKLKAIARASCKVLAEMGPGVEWVHTYVVADKFYCIYRAESEQLVREHANRGGFPANAISEVAAIFGPATAEILKTFG